MEIKGKQFDAHVLKSKLNWEFPFVTQEKYGVGESHVNMVLICCWRIMSLWFCTPHLQTPDQNYLTITNSLRLPCLAEVICQNINTSLEGILTQAYNIPLADNLVVAIYSYEPNHDGDLGFEKGDKLKIINK